MSEAAKDKWHFPRKDLAQYYLNLFNAGLSSARALFARRRMGKTEFLTKDLMPIAADFAFTTVYVNLWEWQANPLAGIKSAVEAELKEQTGLLGKIASSGPKIDALKLSVMGTGLDAKFQDATHDGMEAFWSLIDAHKQSILLLIDEAQVLASDKHTILSGALRAGLDVRKEHVKVIFTGSSEQTLRTMFGRSAMPFYNWAPIESFPLLDNLFVSHMINVANDILQVHYQLADADAQNAFLELNASPEIFRRFLESYITHPFLGVSKAIQAAKEKTYSEDGFERVWSRLNHVDRLVMAFIAKEQLGGLTSKETRTQFGLALGTAIVSVSAVNNALARLTDPTKLMLTKVGHGQYQFEDNDFKDWLLLELE